MLPTTQPAHRDAATDVSGFRIVPDRWIAGDHDTGTTESFAVFRLTQCRPSDSIGCPRPQQSKSFAASEPATRGADMKSLRVKQSLSRASTVVRGG